MKTTPRKKAARYALSAVAAAALTLASTASLALGLGRMAVQSALGETLRAEIDITALSAEEASSLRVKVAPPEAYRAAGIDYNAAMPGTQITVAKRADGKPYLRIVSDRSVQEPFVDLILEISWSSGRLVREYTLLLDPPGNTRLATAPAPAPISPSMSAAPRPPAAAPEAPRPAAAAPPAPAVAAAPAPAPEQRPRRVLRQHRRQHRRPRRVPQPHPRLHRAQPAASMTTTSAAAIRSTGWPRKRNARACRSTRCWWRCSEPTRMPSSPRT